MKSSFSVNHFDPPSNNTRDKRRRHFPFLILAAITVFMAGLACGSPAYESPQTSEPQQPQNDLTTSSAQEPAPIVPTTRTEPGSVAINGFNLTLDQQRALERYIGPLPNGQYRMDELGRVWNSNGTLEGVLPLPTPTLPPNSNKAATNNVGAMLSGSHMRITYFTAGTGSSYNITVDFCASGQYILQGEKYYTPAVGSPRDTLVSGQGIWYVENGPDNSTIQLKAQSGSDWSFLLITDSSGRIDLANDWNIGREGNAAC